MLNIKTLVSGTILATMLASSAAIAPAGAAEKIIFNQFVPKTHLINRLIIKPWRKRVEEITEGRVKFKVPTKSVAGPPQQIEAVERGLADGGYIFNAFLNKSAPLVTLGMLPMLAEKGEARSVALWRTYNKYFQDQGMFENVVLLGFFAAPAGQIYSLSDEPIDSLEDLQNKKLWSLPGTPAQFFKGLDVSVVPGAAVNMYPIISKGAVDAMASMTCDSLQGFKVLKYAKSMTVVPGGTNDANFTLFLSKDAWARISPEDQMRIMKVSGEAFTRTSAMWDNENVQRCGEAVERGMKLVKLDDANIKKFKAVANNMVNDWLKIANDAGLNGQEVLDYYNEQTKLIEAEIANR